MPAIFTVKVHASTGAWLKTFFCTGSLKMLSIHWKLLSLM